MSAWNCPGCGRGYGRRDGQRIKLHVIKCGAAHQATDPELCITCRIPGHDQCGDGPASRPYNADCPCCQNTARALADNL